MEIFLNINPPTSTAQEKKVRIVKGKPIFYDPPQIKEAKELLESHLKPCAPETPFEGPLALSVMWLFPKGNHEHGSWRVSKPDTDNLDKLLKDCMTRCGFWKDDAQVVCERIEKLWSNAPNGIYIELKELEDFK